MDVVSLIFSQITPWHWLAVAIFLLGIEMMIGTFDLLWIAGAAFLTALWAALPIPAPFGGWEAQAIFFAIAGIALLLIGRSTFGEWRKRKTDRPNLNKRSDSLVGRTGVAEANFSGGEGRIKLGDTTWLAQSLGRAPITEGTKLRVDSVDGTLLKVEPL